MREESVMAKNEVVPVVEGGIVKAGSLDEIRKQIELLASMSLPPTMAERYEVVVRDGLKVLRKREKPIKFVLDSPKYDVPVTDTSLPSEKFYRRTRPSRFGDEHRTTAPSLPEVKECFYDSCQ